MYGSVKYIMQLGIVNGYLRALNLRPHILKLINSVSPAGGSVRKDRSTLYQLTINLSVAVPWVKRLNLRLQALSH